MYFYHFVLLSKKIKAKGKNDLELSNYQKVFGERAKGTKKNMHRNARVSVGCVSLIILLSWKNICLAKSQIALDMAKATVFLNFVKLFGISLESEIKIQNIIL